MRSEKLPEDSSRSTDECAMCEEPLFLMVEKKSENQHEQNPEGRRRLLGEERPSTIPARTLHQVHPHTT